MKNAYIKAIKSMFDVANILKTKDVPIDNYKLLNIQACSFLALNIFCEEYLQQSLCLMLMVQRLYPITSDKLQVLSSFHIIH